MPGTKRADDRKSNIVRHREQRCIVGCTLEGRERLLKMTCDLVLAQDAPLSS
jgi:hypothetical protein